GMGYKELQGDEGVVMVRAATILSGDEAEWFNHQKGPAEILLPLAGWGLAGSINDTWARLPFTWAGLLAVLAVYWLGRRWFGARVGLVAGALFAIGGFAIAFSRVVQYQSLVMLWGALSLLMATRYRAEAKRADLIMAVSFLAGGLLAHYDAILAAPAVAWLLLDGWRPVARRKVGPLLAALAAGGLILALFYVPYVLNPNFGRTFDYLLRDRVGVSGDTTLAAGGLADAWRMLTFYNSLWYVLGLAAAVAVGLAVLARQRLGLAAALYFAVPALFYLLLVRDPRTHVYTIFPGAAVLAGLGLTVAWRGIRVRTSRPVPQIAAVIGVLWLLVVTVYPVLLFLDTSVERQRTWAENRPLPALYPATWAEPPEFGLFGFPHQAGWRALASKRSEAPLPYGSNEEPEIADWYMAQAPRTYCQNAETFVVAANAQDAIPYDAGWLSQALLVWGEIKVDGRPSMAVYSREAKDPPLDLEATAYDLWLTPGEARRPLRSGQTPVEANFGKQIRLLGYDLEAEDARPGGRVTVTLYWQALGPIERNYQVFVHLYDGELWAQHDGAPACAIWPTTRWEPGQIVADPHIVKLPAEMPDGPMPVLVGLYDLLTEDRLPVNGDPDGVLRLAEIDIVSG
ncbi:MAG: glycosyltransferase family 39 protein, partial [Chloroflexota bacterium]